MDWTPVITVTGAFIAAFIGQFLGHRYSQRRENEKYNKDRLQHLYSPLVYKIIEYLYCEREKAIETTNPNLFMEDTNQLFKNVQNVIRENLSYANYDLIMQYENANKSGNYNYGEYNSKQIITLLHRTELCSAFLSEYLSINKTLSKIKKVELERAFFFTQVLLILFKLGLFELAVNYGFRSLIEIEHSIKSNNSLLKRSESILKNFDDCKLEEYSSEGVRSAKYNELNATAHAFILDLLSEMEQVYPDTVEMWRNELQKHLDQYHDLIGWNSLSL